MATIFIEAGHSQKDPGASGNGYREADLTSELRNMIAIRLKALGIKAVRLDNDAHDLATVLKEFNPGPDDLLLSLHFNAGPPTAVGTEAFVRKGTAKTSRAALIARDLVKAVHEVASFPLRSGSTSLALAPGVKAETESPRQRLAILHECPNAVLLEVCFISSRNEILKYQQAKQALVNAISDVLSRYYDGSK